MELVKGFLDKLYDKVSKVDMGSPENDVEKSLEFTFSPMKSPEEF